MAVPSPTDAGVATSLEMSTLRSDDLRAAAALHMQALPHGFFVTLGERFLRQYLATYLDDPCGIAIAARRDGQLAGFLVGTADAGTRRGHVIRRHGVRLAFSGLAALMVRPRLAVWFLRTRATRYALAVVRSLRNRSATPSARAAAARTAVLCHVAVKGSRRREGIGAELVIDFERWARLAGAGTAELLTRDGTDGASAFYRRLGWRDDGLCEDRDGLRWTRFVRNLT